MNFTKLGSNVENTLVDSIPEHSNSDIEGSVSSQDIFRGNVAENSTDSSENVNVLAIVTDSCVTRSPGV